MRFFPTRPPWVASVALVLAGLFGPAARAHHWQLESASLPAPFLRDGRVDVAIEPSGIAPIGDGRRILVAHDKGSSLHVVDIATGALVGAPLDSPKFFPTTGTSTTWAGMAQNSEGNYYLVSSGNGKNDGERAARSAVVRFRLLGGETPAIDEASVVRWEIGRPLEAALRAQRLDAARVARQRVVGLAIREVGGHRQLVIGLGAPEDMVRALVADGETRRARPYATFEVAMKAAGLAVLGVEASGHMTTVTLLITYDNDPHATRIPSRFQTARLVHPRS